MLNLGTPEIILIFISLIFVGLFIFGIVVLLKYFLKKNNDQYIHIPSNTYKMHFESVQPTGNAEIERPKKSNEERKTDVKIALPQQSEIRYVKVNEIIRCEADDNYTNFILGDEKILISKSLKEYADLLKPHGFLRTHQSHLVNPQFVKSWLKEDGGTLLMDNGDKIPVSKPNRESIKEALGK